MAEKLVSSPKTSPTISTSATANQIPSADSTISPFKLPKKHQRFCLKWDKYQTNLTNIFEQLLQNESFVDVTLACDGRAIKAHKIILSACSPYFQSLFLDNPCEHPTIIMRDVEWGELKAAIEFMYKGEVNVLQEQIGPLLRVAEMLKIRGLTEIGDTDISEIQMRKVQEEMMENLADIMAVESKRDDVKIEVDSAERETAMEDLKSFRRRCWTPPLEKRRKTEAVAVREDGEKCDDNFREPNWNGKDAGRPIIISSPETNSAPNTRSASEEPLPSSLVIDDFQIKPEIAEMIREEEKAKYLENSQSWFGTPTASPFNAAADRYQYQLQSMWQRYWSSNQNLFSNLRSRDRGPLKSWRPDTMAEAIFSVLKDGLTLSQAARKYDIPYPTFVLYANRVHNMLGPSDGGIDLRPKGRGRPQRILLGAWPDEHIKGVIKAVVFRDGREYRDEGLAFAGNDTNAALFNDGSSPGLPMRRFDNLLNPNGFRFDSEQMAFPSMDHINRGQLNWNMAMNDAGATRSSSRGSSQN